MPYKQHVPGAAFRSLAFLVVALAATFAFRALGTTTLFEDGPLLVDLLSSIRERPPLWYHAAYVPLAWALEFAIGRGHVASALLWASALSGAVGLAAFVALALRRAPTASGALVFVALAAAPGLWANATRIEVHATQFLGAALLLWAAVRHAEGAAWRTRTWLALAAAFAVTCHNSHLGALPGVVWLAADPRTATPLARRISHAALPVAGGAALGWSINAVADVSPASTESLRHLLSDFFVGGSWPFVEQELVRLWFPPFVAFALVVATRARPLAALYAAAPALAAGLPSLALFTTLGIWTSGGYFTTAAVFVSGAALAAAREPARFTTSAWSMRLLAASGAFVLVFLAKPVARDSVTSALRTDGERLADLRFAALCELLPSGGLLISVEGTTCCINGRDLRWREWSLMEGFVAAVRSGSTPDAVVADLVAQNRADFAHEALLVDTSYQSDEFLRPRVGPAMQLLFDGLAATHTPVPVERSGRTFVHLVPRESP